MSNKKILLTTLMLLATLMLPGGNTARADRDTSDDAFLLQKALALTLRMDRLAETDYVRLFTADGDIALTANEFGSYDYAEPAKAYVLSVDANALLPLMDADDIASSLPDDVRAILLRRLPAAIPNRLTGQGGVTLLATASILACGESYPAPSISFENAIVLFLYTECPYAIAVSFSPSGEGLVAGSAIFFKTPDNMQSFADLLTMITAAFPEGSVTMTEYTSQEIAALLAK